MTQEREAMERLEAEIGKLHDSAALVAIQSGSELKRTLFEGEVAAFKMALHEIQKYKQARHARSLQPITVEGLVAMGAIKQTRGGYLIRATCLSFWHYEDTGRFEFYVCSKPAVPQPQFLGDVDNLIERLSR